MNRLLILAALSAVPLAGCFPGNETPPPYPGGMTVERHGQEIDFSMRDEVLFPNDSAQVSPRAYGLIARVADEAHHRGRFDLLVNGYTDTTGTFDYNMGLSQARAQAVADVLVHNGIAPARIQAQGFGETHLAVPTPQDVHEPRNRRVVIRLLPPMG